MVELTGGTSSRQLAERLLDQDILIKDLGTKMAGGEGQYVRIAVKRPEENDLLVAALAQMEG